MTRKPISITELKETDAHKKSGHTARAKWRTDHPAETRYDNVPTEFVSIDGEGITLADGTHYYVLLGIGQNQITAKELGKDYLDFEDCLSFLWKHFRTGSVAYTGFFLSYDFIQMFRRLPEERARMLLTAEGRAKRQPKSKKRIQPFPVEWKGWDFDILGNKRFRFRKKGSKRWMNICDSGPFFQKAFVKVINPENWSEPVCTQEEYDEIVREKKRRSTAKLGPRMLHYNRLENEIHSRVMCRLNEGFQQLGIHLAPGQWFGPGQAAQAWLDGKAIESEILKTITPSEVLEAAIASYFGGWFETMAHGLLPGVTHEYDINSAYPYIISMLPCLEHGTWIHQTGVTATQQQYTLVYAKVTGSDPCIGTMLHRDSKGNICRPDKTEGWYWYHELQAAQKAGVVDVCDIRESWSYNPCDCPAPLSEVRDIYALRMEVGKKTPLGITCKLVPNSLYGKFAQSIGNPKYANPIYASLITASCRTMILDAIATHPRGTKDVVMVATDGVYFRSEHPYLPTSDALGDWEHGYKSNLCIFKPGVYWDDEAREEIRKGESPVFKARGINATAFGKRILEVDTLFEACAVFNPEATKWPRITFPYEFAMVTALQALIRNDWSLAGTIIPNPEHTDHSSPRKKRDDPYYDEEGILRSHPKKNDPYIPSYPYEKRFGLDDPFSLENSERLGITPDGPPIMAITDALGYR
jgi:DNA polymerase type B, organellar and viral